MKKTILPILVLIYGCTHQEGDLSEYRIPDHINELENVTVFSPDAQAADTLELIQETVFESNGDVIIPGSIRDVVIDDMDRVYIYTLSTDSRANNASIFVFGPDGSFLGTVGRYGRGPGEYTDIGSVDISDDKIHVLDTSLNKIITYSTSNFELLSESIIDKSTVPGDEELVHRSSSGDELMATDNGLILRFRTIGRNPDSDIPYVQFYKLSDDGVVLPEKILEVDRFPFFFPSGNTGVHLPFVMPFTRNSIVRVTQNSNFIVNWTEDFLIKIHDEHGSYLRAFYYPIEKHDLSVDEMDVIDGRRRVLNNYQLPQTWPALHNMEVDDEDRIWVATIDESDSSFQWWLLDLNGNLIAKFRLPGDRNDRDPWFGPRIKIKNGYFYSRERDIREGINRIIKSRIVLHQN